MKTRWVERWSFTQIIALSFYLTAWESLAAESRSWVLLTNCQYIANPENDGDSFRVRSGTNEFLLRLYFVDAPEANLRYPDRTREQSEYFGTTLDETMKGGRAARDLVRNILQDPFTVWTRHASAGGRSKEPRYYGFVLIGTNALDKILIRKGLARPKGVRPNLPTGEKAAAHNQDLQALEAEAKAQKIGLWAVPPSKTASPGPGQL
jgi:endonuclease YncB( thermonuclease family)